MIDPLIYADGRVFATGVTKFISEDRVNVGAERIFLEVSIEGLHTIAAVDTGAYYFICDPELTGGLQEFFTDPLPFGDKGMTQLEIRGRKYQGKLYLLSVEFLDASGSNLQVQSTVFVPELMPGETWNLPSFIGYQGCLDRIRFAIDPEHSYFYFGPLGEMD